MTDLEQDLLIAQAEAGELKRKLIEREMELRRSQRRQHHLAVELESLRTDIIDVCGELEKICQRERPETTEIMRQVLMLGKLIDQGR